MDTSRGNDPIGLGWVTLVLAHTQQTFFPAEFVAVDTGTRRATVRSAIGSAIVTRLVGVPLQTGPTRFALLPSTAGLRVNDLPSPLDVPLPAGATRHGLMIDRVDDRPQLTRWFEFGTDGGEVSITPNGRWATLRFARKLDSARILCEGPGGELAQLAIPPSEQPIPLFVAAGTTAIHVDAPPLERQTFEPTLAEIVVR